MSNINSLFATPLQTTISPLGLIDVELKKHAYKLKQENNPNEITSQKGFQSLIYDPKDYLITKNFWDMNIDTIRNYLSHYEIIQNFDFNSNEIWFNINPKYSYLNTHTHCNCDFSGVYYVEVPKGSGDIVFENPNPVMMNKGFYQGQFNNNEFNSNSYRITPRDNMLILFPSYLPHRVEQNLSEKDRISVSFNINISFK